MASLLSYALTTVADVKESLGIASSDTTKDNLITRKINQATRAIEAYCGRRFKATDYSNEEYTATQTDQLVLKQRPVISITSLDIRDTGLNEENWESIDTNLYFSDDNAGVINTLFTFRGRWDRYRVTYRAGYETIPEDLAEACASLAAYYYQIADGSGVGLSLKQEGQRKVQYDNSKLSFSDVMQQLGIDQIIESYANYPIATGG